MGSLNFHSRPAVTQSPSLGVSKGPVVNLDFQPQLAVVKQRFLSQASRTGLSGFVGNGISVMTPRVLFVY